ncbi:PEP/pyruvate-binding domain-containing protein [Microbacterium hominis]|uniref:Phosphoenolpyruvate synthase n=1 Tax=Microbacterium hominis TaxID=162426 RepID=A0A7D4UAP8_9MICO|nr:PEP/pyruvate-binding domain-containing protein [Microbacterium hominis]QKJ18723.1 phosphoenolpyruvate synthase [Microbacterium hominis]
MSSSWCLPLADLSAADLETAGGKGANLGELVRAGFAVPPGFVVSTAAYRAAVTAVAAGVDASGRDDAAARVPDAVRGVPLPEEVGESIRSAYAGLGGGRVAVRSSATAEDLPGAAFAGQQDTFLGIEGEDAVLDAVQRCWASLRTERAVAYRARLGIDENAVAIAVVVQRMVPADLAGVLFTADPVTGRRDRTVIDSSPGLGEAVVSGLVTPDHAVLGTDGTVIERRAGRAGTVIRQRASGGTEEVHAAEDEDAARLTAAQLAQLAGLGRRIAAHFGRPQDIEWAFADGEPAILQARPMTALPPAPIRLTRRQRLTGPVILELVPRRPFPMELSAWIEPNVGLHVERLVGGIVGARFSLRDVLPAVDGVVQQFVPPNPEPTRQVPRTLLRTIGRFRRDPRAWERDPRLAGFRADVDALAARDVRELTWDELVGIPDLAGRLTDRITALRVEYLPPAGAALVRLRVLLTMLGQRGLFAPLVLDAHTATQAANARLAELAALIRARPGLARRAGGLGGPQLHDLVVRDPEAAEVREGLNAFLAEFGHRETASILLPKDPTWSDDPGTVLALVAVLLDDGADRRPDPAAAAAALEAVLRHPLIRATRSARRVRRLVHTAAAAVTVREDTHFELTRTMPIVRHAVQEIGRRLADAGVLADADDAWLLTLDDLRNLPTPRDPRGELAAAAARRRAAYGELAGSPLIAPTTLYGARRTREVAGALVTGFGGGGGRAAGPVRIVRGPDEFATLRTGEVLVCAATNPSWTPLFARAAAVVVDNGGLASHAAIVAREYGIAAVMGTGDGTSVLEDGARVVVDGDRGAVFPEGPDAGLR